MLIFWQPKQWPTGGCPRETALCFKGHSHKLQLLIAGKICHKIARWKCFLLMQSLCPYFSGFLVISLNMSSLLTPIFTFQSHFWQLFVFGCFDSRSGYKDRPIGRFSPSPSVVWWSVLWPGDWRILYIYIPAPFTESFDRLGRRMIFKVAGAGIELELHSSSWDFSERLIH